MDGDVVSDIMDFYMTWIACILREIELMTLMNAISIVYIYRENICQACNHREHALTFCSSYLGQHLRASITVGEESAEFDVEG